MLVQRHKIIWDDEKVSRLWDYYSTTAPYSEIYFSRLFGDKLLFTSGLPLKQRLTVLDFGCGPGYVWDHLRSLQAAWEYTGVDFSQEGVTCLNKRATGSEYFRGGYHISCLPTPLAPGSFDVVLMFEVVEHLNDSYLEETLHEATRLLKDGGCLVISTPNDEHLADSEKFCPECGTIFHEWQHVRSWNITTLNRYVQRFGFSLVRFKTLDFSATGLLHSAVRVVKLLMNKQVRKPHLIAVFQKVPHR